MELFSIRIQRTFQLVSTILEESHSLKCPFELLKKALIPMLPYPLFKRHDKGIN